MTSRVHTCKVQFLICIMYPVYATESYRYIQHSSILFYTLTGNTYIQTKSYNYETCNNKEQIVVYRILKMNDSISLLYMNILSVVMVFNELQWIRVRDRSFLVTGICLPCTAGFGLVEKAFLQSRTFLLRQFLVSAVLPPENERQSRMAVEDDENVPYFLQINKVVTNVLQ